MKRGKLEGKAGRIGSRRTSAHSSIELSALTEAIAARGRSKNNGGEARRKEERKSKGKSKGKGKGEMLEAGERRELQLQAAAGLDLLCLGASESFG